MRPSLANPPFLPAAKRSKFNVDRSAKGIAKRTVDNITFASTAEARRYGELKLLMRAGHIGPFEIQPEYPCVVNGKFVCKYVADFAYWDWKAKPEPRLIVEDVKGFKTKEYRLKKKLVEAVHGITITEVS